MASLHGWSPPTPKPPFTPHIYYFLPPLSNKTKERQRKTTAPTLEKKKMKKMKKKKETLFIFLMSLLLLQTLVMASSDLGCRRAGECEWEMEMEMESETSRRMLWGTLEKRYISYSVLRRDRVPCNHPGAPYYSCHGNGETKANPYVRGCSIIAGCRQR